MDISSTVTMNIRVICFTKDYFSTNVCEFSLSSILFGIIIPLKQYPDHIYQICGMIKFGSHWNRDIKKSKLNTLQSLARNTNKHQNLINCSGKYSH